MDASILPNILILIVIFGAFAWTYLAQKKHRRHMEECAARLGVEDAKVTDRSIAGTIRGMPIEVKFVSSTKNTPAHTTVEVKIPPSAFLLNLRRQDAAEIQKVEKGEAVDLQVGDRALDDAWIVEGAPPERVLRVLSDPALRAQLVAFSALDTPSIIIEDGKLLLYRRGTEAGPEGIATDRVELAVALAEAVRRDAETELPPGEIDVAAASYRSARRVDPDVRAEAQVRELKVLRATRSLAELRIATIAAQSMVTIALFASQFLAEAGPTAAGILLLFGAIMTVALLGQYRKLVNSAPGVPRDRLALGWIAGCWAVNLLAAARAFLV